MQAIRSKNTKPELTVRRLLHKMGYRFRLHADELPGKPDIVFRKRKKAIFVHGCFWHSHPDPTCRNSQRPQRNTAFWDHKLDSTRSRDQAAADNLHALGWQILILWECELVSESAIAERLSKFLDG